ncbi:phage tail length tape measure family protein [Aliidiomarina sp. Khilg15.8]
MSRSTVANLVARLDADTARFQREMQKADKQTLRYQKQARAANDGNIRLASTFQRAGNAASVLNGPLNGVSGRLSFIATGMRSVGAAGLALGVGIGAASMGLSSAAAAGDQYLRSEQRIEAQVRATSQAVGLSTEELMRQSEEVARGTLASSEGIRKAQGQLLRFTSVTGDQFSRTIRLSQDYAAVTGKDVASAAERLGRILEEPTEAFSRLRREGIHLTQTQRELITSLVETGDTARAQAEVLDILEARLGGAGSGENVGIGGAADSLSQTWNQMLREIDETTKVGAAAAATLERLDDVMKSIRDGAAGADGSMEYMNDEELYRARFDVDSAIQEIEREREETREKIGKALDGKRYSDLSNLSPTKFKVDKLTGDLRLLRNEQEEKRRLSEMYEEEIQRREDEAEKARLAAQKAADERRKSQEADAAKARQEEQAKELEKRQTKSMQMVQSLEVQYADEEEKRAIAHERQLAQISTLYADKEALERMGFETLEELRTHYLELEREAYKNRTAEILAEEEEKRNKEEEAARSRIESIQNSMATEQELLAIRRDERIKELQELHEKELIEEQEFLDLKAQLHADHDDRLKQMQAMQLSAALGNYSELFEGVAGLTEQFAGKQSGIYKTMFAASKAFAVADSTVQIINGIAKAANLPFPANLGAMATVGASTAGLISSIQGTELAGARANGGPVGNGYWLVGERGPEVLDMNGGRGQITSNENLRAALGNGGEQSMGMQQHFHFEALNHEAAVELLMQERATLTNSIMAELEDRGIVIG